MTRPRAGGRAAAGPAGGARRASQRGPLSDEDVRLWEMMKQRLEPLRKPKTRVVAHQSGENDGALAAASLPPSRTGKTKAVATIHRPAARPGIAPKIQGTVAAPAPAIIEKRKSRQLAKGQKPIEAVLDLHGMRQREAHAALRHFLVGAHAGGKKFVKVITGKGARASAGDARQQPFDAPFDPGGGERGVLKRLVPEWLSEAGLSRIVVGLSSAGRGHGGDGAIYVELRRKSRTPL
jgi:DNA-nicking Smr family endonuclease